MIFVGAGANAPETGVAVGAAHGELGHVAGAAVHLEARVDQAVGDLAAYFFAIEISATGYSPCLDPPDHGVHQRPRRLELGGRVGELVRYHLVVGDRPSEGAALACVLDSSGRGFSCAAPIETGAPDSRSYCSCHIRCANPLAGLGADQVAVRHDDVVERDLGGVTRRASRAC